MKYLINDTYWERESGPIFFYAGNEGAIEMFCENTVRCKAVRGLICVLDDKKKGRW